VLNSDWTRASLMSLIRKYGLNLAKCVVYFLTTPIVPHGIATQSDGGSTIFGKGVVYCINFQSFCEQNEKNDKCVCENHPTTQVSELCYKVCTNVVSRMFFFRLICVEIFYWFLHLPSHAQQLPSVVF